VGAHAIAVAVDGDKAGVVQEPVRDRDRDGGVVKDLTSVSDVAVGGQEDRAVLMAAGDDLGRGRLAALADIGR